jgi:hypothetical protein
MGHAVGLLRDQMDDAYAIFLRCVAGVTDHEYRWEPTTECWRVFLDEHGRWTADYAEPDPEPPPFTTIGWRMAHVATCKVMYHEWAFGPRRLTWDVIESPHDVAGALAMLEEGQAALLEDLASLRDEDLDLPRLTNWGEEWPAWQIFWTMIHHDLQHGGEIGALHDLYRVTGGAPASPGRSTTPG